MGIGGYIMNRFLIDYHPEAIARQLCDQHITKMPLEEAQMLSHALHRHMGNEEETFADFNKRMGLQNGPKIHAKHPCTIWAGDTRANYRFALNLLEEMCIEKTLRFGKPHKCQQLIPKFLELEHKIPDGRLTAHPQCFSGHDDLKIDDPWPVQSYRQFYIVDKLRFARYNKCRSMPDWLGEYSVKTVQNI